VCAVGADVGFAFDGDGDRLIAVDEKGGRLSGDPIMAICARMYKELGLLKNNRIVATVMSNFGLFEALRELGIQVEVSKVGDRYVLEMMQEKGAVLGGEESGHVIFLNHHTAGDGIIAALQLLRAVKHHARPLSELAKIMTPSPQRVINVDVKNKPPLDRIPALQKAIREAEAELGDKGRVLIRYSGTQSMCRVMVEGPSEELTDRLARTLADTVEKSIR
jgi:phosphoglucosamine mutase